MHGMSLMLEEIRQQPEVLGRTLDRPPSALARIARRFAGGLPPLIVLVARGTSDNAALFGRYLFEITLGIPSSLAAPSVATLYRNRSIPPDALVIGISQSGESTDINAYMRLAKAGGCFTIGITNETASALASLAHEVLPTQAGKEASVAATKTYTAQVLMLYCLARALGAEIPEHALKALPGAVDSQLAEEAAVRDLAWHYRGMTHALVVARGLNYANGFEFALKLMETSYVVAAGFSAADFAHGPIAMVEEGFPVFVFTPPGPTFGETGKLLARLDETRVDSICIGAEPEVKNLPFSHWIRLTGSLPSPRSFPADTFTPIPSIVPAQLFAAHLAEIKGFNPDKPRMLSKVTRTM